MTSPTPQLLFYCQHVLGMGHFMRSAALLEALDSAFEVTFLNGGGDVPGVPLPTGVQVVSLPQISSDEDFVELNAEGMSVDQALDARRRTILETDAHLRPDVVVVELFPFGRKKFARELIPWLARIRRERPDTLVACSVRDILVSRDDQGRHDRRVVETLNRYFDVVLVHSDDRFQPLEASFAAANAIDVDIEHTGYVIGRPRTDESGLPSLATRETHLPLVTASIGGGRVGGELLEATIVASGALAEHRPHRLVVATGPYMADDVAAGLVDAAADHDHIEITSFVSSFDELLARSALSISMAGYNTCMNLAVANIAAMVLPFTGGANDEQSSRASRLAAMGAVEVLTDTDIADPERLADRIDTALGRTTPPTWSLDLHGATTTAAVLASRVADRASSVGSVRLERQNPFTPLLAPVTDLAEPLDVFVRDDDIGEIDDRLLDMIDIGIVHDLPITLAVVPTWVTASSARRLKDLVRAHPGLLELHQHGLRHVNHETAGKKHEFGPSRDHATQLHDIGEGMRMLRERLGSHFFPAFTPPWNRCTDDTFTVLDELGFAVLSKDVQGNQLVTGHRFVDVSTSVDIFTWKGDPTLRAVDDIAHDIVASAATGRPVGILLHHEVMGPEAMTLFDDLAAALGEIGARGHTFASLLATVPQRQPSQAVPA